MEQITLKATRRDLLGKKVKILRGKGQIPAVLYGKKMKTIPLLLDKREFLKLADRAGESTLINLEMSQKEPAKVLIRAIQKDPVSDDLLHVDLYKVDMAKEIQTEIPLEFVGASPAVEELEGNLITNKDAIKVSCLPDRLVPKIEVDVTSLKTFEDLIRVSDLTVPEGIKVLEEPDDIVAQVTPPRSEEELKEIEEGAAAETEKAQIEGIEAAAQAEKAKKEEAQVPEAQPTEIPSQEQGPSPSQGKQQKA